MRTTRRIIGAAIMAARTRPWGVNVVEEVFDDAAEGEGLIEGVLVGVETTVASAVELELMVADYFTRQYCTECFLDWDVLMYPQHSTQRPRNLRH